MGFTNIYIHKGCNKNLVNETIKRNGAGHIKFKAKGIEQQSFILQALEGIYDETILLLGFGVGPHWSQHVLDDEVFESLKKQNCEQVAELIGRAEKNRLNVISLNPIKNRKSVESFDEIKPFGCTCLLKVSEKIFCIGQETKQIVRHNA